MSIRPSIRLANLSDSKLVQKISAEAYISAYQGVIDGVPRPANENYLERIKRKEVWVIRPFGSVCGIIVLEQMPNHILIYSVAVRPRYQRHGYGKALVDFAEQQAIQRSLFEIRLYTNSRMEKNLALYRKWGFVEVERRSHPTRPGEILVDMANSIPARRV